MGWSAETQKLEVARILKKRGIRCMVSKPDAAESTVRIEVDRDEPYMMERVDMMRDVEQLFPPHVYVLWAFEVKMPEVGELVKSQEVEA